MHEPEFAESVLDERYPQSGLAQILGFYTYRFLRICTALPNRRLNASSIPDGAAAADLHRKHKTYRAVLRNEVLADDLIKLASEHRVLCGFRPDAIETVRAENERVQNSSTKRLPAYRDFYDERSKELVRSRDSFIAEEFGYSF